MSWKYFYIQIIRLEGPECFSGRGTDGLSFKIWISVQNISSSCKFELNDIDSYIGYETNIMQLSILFEH